MNKIIAIGYMGSRQCYLNVSREEAMRRYRLHNDMAPDEPIIDHIAELDFDDEFSVYDIWTD